MSKVSRPVLLCVATFVTATLSACNYREDKGTVQEPPAVITAADLNYANVNAKVIAPYCLGCHSAAGANRGDINLETYEAVTALIDSVRSSAIDERTMPPSSSASLPTNRYELLKAWIEAGAPQ